MWHGNTDSAKERKANGRKMPESAGPNGAKCRTAPGAEERELPNGA